MISIAPKGNRSKLDGTWNMLIIIIITVIKNVLSNVVSKCCGYTLCSE